MYDEVKADIQYFETQVPAMPFVVCQLCVGNLRMCVFVKQCGVADISACRTGLALGLLSHPLGVCNRA